MWNKSVEIIPVGDIKRQVFAFSGAQFCPGQRGVPGVNPVGNRRTFRSLDEDGLLTPRAIYYRMHQFQRLFECWEAAA